MRIETIGDCQLILGDCLEILPTLVPFDHCITDPPYGTQDLGDGYGRRQLHTENGRKGRTIKNDFDLSVFEAALKLLPMNDGFILAFYSSRKIKEFLRAIGELEYIGEIIWDKRQMGLGYTIRYSHESIAIIRKGTFQPETPIDSVISAHQLEKLHPHQKPVDVIKKLVNWLPGTICDPFMGIGTTGVACAKLGRKFIGIEIHEPYFDMACKRIESAYKQADLFIPQTS